MRKLLLCSGLSVLGCAPELEPAEGRDVTGQLLSAPSPVLLVPTLVPGQTAVLEVDQALAGETVRVVLGDVFGTGPCPAVLGGRCTDVDGVLWVGSAVADAAGHAEVLLAVPAGAPIGVEVYLQAAIPRGPGGVGSVLSAVAVGTVGAIDADGDGHDTLTDCDDSDPDVNPDALEMCDGIDNDCDPSTTEDGLITLESRVNLPTIQDAVDNASWQLGAEIHLCPGTYDQDVVIEDDAVTLRGIGDPGEVVLSHSGSSLYHLQVIGNAGGTVIENLTVAGSNHWMALRVYAETTVRDVVFEHNNATDMISVNAPTTFERVTLRENVSSRALVSVHHDNLTLIDSDVLDNTGAGSFAMGLSGSVVLDGGRVLGNEDTVNPNSAVFQVGDLGVPASLEVNGTDFGTGADDNLTGDVTVQLGATWVDYLFGDGASFTCIGGVGC